MKNINNIFELAYISLLLLFIQCYLDDVHVREYILHRTVYKNDNQFVFFFF
jgi:hypothetical protein